MFALFYFLFSIVYANPNWSGTYSNGDTTIQLKQNGGEYTGTILLAGETFPIVVTQMGESSIEISIDMFGEQFPFQAQRDSSGLIFSDGETTTRLTKVDSQSSLANPPPVRPKDEEYTSSHEVIPDSVHTPQEKPEEVPNISFENHAVSSSNPIHQFKHDDVKKKSKSIKKSKKAVEKHQGYSFHPPADWIVKRDKDGYGMGHNTIPGFIMLIKHDATSLDQVRQDSQKGFELDEKTTFHLSGSFLPYGENGLRSVFTTQLQEHTSASAITVLSPHGGGVTAIVIVFTSKYTIEHQAILYSLIDSIQFFPPVPYPVDTKWKEKLRDHKLTYMYSSSSSGYDGSYTASSDKRIIGLCSAGHFTFYSNSSDTVNAGFGPGSTMGSGSTAMMHGTKRGNGSWNVINRDGNPVLTLDFYDGRKHEYDITQEDYKLHLNGIRYFRTSGQQGPSCD